VSAHRAARLFALAAHFGAGFHLGVVPRQAFAIFGTHPADFGAKAASATVHRRIPKHKIGAGLAAIGTIQQQPNMPDFGVCPAHLQAVRNRRQTNRVAIQAVFDTLAHFGAQVGSFEYLHFLSPKLRAVSYKPNVTCKLREYMGNL
jgi:hypothetical protein